MADKTLIITGLGNPGKKHEMNRHNVGFLVLDALAEKLGTNFSGTKWEAETARGRRGGMDILLIKPQTFMNLSGKSVSQAMRFYKAKVTELLVVHDEIELGFADNRMKKGGGHKGHNGLRDIIQKCGSADYHRLRVGVDRPTHPDVAGYVLNNFNKDEQKVLPRVYEDCCKLILDWIDGYAE